MPNEYTLSIPRYWNYLLQIPNLKRLNVPWRLAGVSPGPEARRQDHQTRSAKSGDERIIAILSSNNRTYFGQIVWYGPDEKDRVTFAERVPGIAIVGGRTVYLHFEP